MGFWQHASFKESGEAPLVTEEQVNRGADDRWPSRHATTRSLKDVAGKMVRQLLAPARMVAAVMTTAAYTNADHDGGKVAQFARVAELQQAKRLEKLAEKHSQIKRQSQISLGVRDLATECLKVEWRARKDSNL